MTDERNLFRHRIEQQSWEEDFSKPLIARAPGGCRSNHLRISKSSTCTFREHWGGEERKGNDDAERGIQKRWKNRTRPQIVPRFTAPWVSRWHNHRRFLHDRCLSNLAFHYLNRLRR